MSEFDVQESQLIGSGISGSNGTGIFESGMCLLEGYGSVTDYEKISIRTVVMSGSGIRYHQ